MASGVQIDFLLSPYIYNGNALSGGTVAFYEAGTTTPYEVFADSDLTVSLGTEVTLDSNGVAVVFVDGTTLLKLIISTEAGVEIDTIDGATYYSGLSDATLYYKRDGSLPLTGNMQVNGYNMTNVGNLTTASGKYIFANHGSTYTPTTSDMFVFGDDVKTFKINSSGETGYLWDSDDTGTPIMAFNRSGVTFNEGISATGDVLITGDEHITGNLNVDTNLAVTGTVDATGATTLGSTLDVTGLTTLSDGISAAASDGTLVFNGSGLQVSTGASLGGILAMNSNFITGVTAATASGQAVEYAQLNTALDLRVLKAGDTMTGNLVIDKTNSTIKLANGANYGGWFENTSGETHLYTSVAGGGVGVNLLSHKLAGLTAGTATGHAVEYDQFGAHTGAANPHSGSASTGDLSTHTGATGSSVHGLGTVSTLASVTTVGSTGSDTNVPTEQAVREAIAAIPGYTTTTVSGTSTLGPVDLVDNTTTTILNISLTDIISLTSKTTLYLYYNDGNGVTLEGTFISRLATTTWVQVFQVAGTASLDGNKVDNAGTEGWYEITPSGGANRYLIINNSAAPNTLIFSVRETADYGTYTGTVTVLAEVEK